MCRDASSAIFNLNSILINGDRDWSAVLYFAVLVVVGASNAVNLTDGLDGLASGCSVVTFLAYSVYCYVNGIHDIGLFSAILAGGCVGFLFFNYHPAEIFMGDTGSLALGGAVAGIAIVTKTELLLIFFRDGFCARSTFCDFTGCIFPINRKTNI